MLRSIKSGQRKMRIMALKVATDSLTGPDQKKASISGLAVTFDVPFAETPVIIAPGATISGESASGFTLSVGAEVLVIGSDTSEKY